MEFHFLIFAFSIIFWSFSLYFYNNPILFHSLEWLKLTFALTIIIVFELFWLIVVISGKSLKKLKTFFIIATIFFLLIIFLIFLNQDLENYLLTLHPQTPIFYLLFFIYISLGGAIIFERFLKGTVIDHIKVVYLLISFGAFIIAITILYLFLPPILGSKKYFWLGPLFAFLFLLSFIIGYYLIKEVEKRKEAEKISEEWAKLARAKDQLLLSLQHHLRTPLVPIKGYLEGILEGVYGREENPVIKEKLIEMRKLTDNLFFLIETLLDIEEIRMGKKILNLENSAIENLIEGIIEELKPEAEKKGLYLKFEPLPYPLPLIKIDKKRLREAIWNLVDNAIKYTQTGGVTIKLKIENSSLKIFIIDTGIGMEKEEIDYFLEGKLFERGEEAKKLYGPGRGIGLMIATEFAKVHGGKILAESKGKGQGTTFWLELPIKD